MFHHGISWYHSRTALLAITTQSNKLVGLVIFYGILFVFFSSYTSVESESFVIVFCMSTFTISTFLSLIAC